MNLNKYFSQEDKHRFRTILKLNKGIFPLGFNLNYERKRMPFISFSLYAGMQFRNILREEGLSEVEIKDSWEHIYINFFTENE